MVETTEAAQMAVQNDSIVPLCNANNTEESKIGWALRRTDRASPLDVEVKKEVERMIRDCLDGGRRAEACEIKDQLRDLRLSDGSYKFRLKRCLSESQIKSQITRVLNIKKKERSKDGSGNDEEAEKVLFLNFSYSTMKFQNPDDQTKKRGRKRNEVNSINGTEVNMNTCSTGIKRHFCI